MSSSKLSEFRPFFSLIIIILTLFSMVFLKMEVRRMGYSVLKETRAYKTLQDRYRLRAMELAHMTRPEHIRRYAMSKLTLGDARQGQIIQLIGTRVAVPQ